MSANVWTTREGHRVRIRDMEDSHLVNTVRFIRRRNRARRFWLSTRAALRAASYAATAPDGAADAAYGSIAYYETEAGKDYLFGERYPIFEKLLAEAARRGLDTRTKRDAPDVAILD